MARRYSRATAERFSSMLLIGIIFSVTFSFATFSSSVITLGTSLGLAFVVSGLVALYQELMNLKVGTPDEPRFDDIASRLAHPDLREILDKRGEYTRYHEWSAIRERNDIFFAGHSVLHRIKADFESLPIGNVEDAVLRKLEDGSSIRILFLDPSWNYVEEIIRSQDQPVNEFYQDLHVTLSVIRSISEKVLALESLRGSIEIKMCRHNLQYSYHYIRYIETETVEMLVGFYFSGLLGIESPLFRVESESIQKHFDSHFARVFRDAKKIFIYNPHEKRLFTEHFDPCLKFVSGKSPHRNKTGLKQARHVDGDA